MTTLRTKLVRDVRLAVWQFLAITVVAALGIALFHGIFVGQENQREAYQVSYERLAFADLTLQMDGAPRAVVREIARIPGVLAAEGRLVADLEVEQSTGRRPRVTGRLIGLPSGREPGVNRVRVLQGRGLAEPPRREVLLEAGFAREHGYRPGDRIYPVVQYRRVALTVVGIAATPEYIYPIQSRQFLLPTPETFGVMFTATPELEALLGLPGTINEIVLRAEPDQVPGITGAALKRLRSYGPQKPMPQSEQPSNQALQSDLEGNRPFMVVMPALFLGSAALAVSLLLARWVQSQRGQIGFLRASGFGAPAILFHYLEVGLLVGVGGGLLGVLLGHLLGIWMSHFHQAFFTVPYPVWRPHPEIASVAFGLSVLACLMGAAGPALRASRIPPAEAMRGEVPPPVRLLKHLRLPLLLALPLRNLLRRPLRSLSTAASVAAAVVLVVVSGSFRDSLEEVERVYLREIQRYDLVAAFAPARSEAILPRLRSWPGVLRVEGALEIAVNVRHAGREKETVAIGVPPDSRLRRLPGLDGPPLEPPAGGGLFSEELAQRLDVRGGALLRLDYVQNRRDRRVEADVRAGAVVRQPIGFPVYLRLEELQRRFAGPLGLPPDAVTSALLQVDPAYLTRVRDQLQDTDGVALVQTKAELEAQIRRLTAYTRTFVWIMFLFGAAMAFAGTYTATDSVLWERTRELATLRTLGFGMKRLALLVSIENVTVALVGAVAGLFPGRLVAEFLIRASRMEGFTLKAVVAPRTYLIALGGALLLTLCAQWPGFHRIRGLNLAAEIRARDE